MGYLDDLIAQSQNTLGRLRHQAPATARDAVRHDLYEDNMFTDLVDEAPALAEMIDEFGEKYDYSRDMLRDVLMEFWQEGPEVRAANEMDPRYLHNHAVATDLDASPDTAEMRGFTKHDKYGSAMATLSVAQEIRETLENLPDDLEQAAEEAAQQQQQQQQAMQQLAQALAEAMASAGMAPGSDEGGADQGESGEGGAEEGGSDPVQGAAGGTEPGAGGQPGYQGEGPLTEAQQAAADALAGALGGATAQDEATRQAMAQAQELAGDRAVRLMKPIQDGMGKALDQLKREDDLFSHWGLEPGVVQRMSFEERRRLIEALSNNRISKWLDLVGRFRMMVTAEYMHHVEYGRDEVYDVEISGRIEDMVGSEVARLAHPALRLDLLSRIAESEVLTTKYRGKERVGRGALIFVGDVSGSMKLVDKHGVSREAWMKAFLLSMFQQAKLQRRDLVVILFSSTGQQKMWEFPKGQADIWTMVEVIEFFWNGGTNFMQPLDMATDKLERDFNDAGTMRGDIIFCTDDDCEVTEAWMKAYLERKERLDFRVFGVAVGARVGNVLHAISNQARDMQEFVEPNDVADIVRML